MADTITQTWQDGEDFQNQAICDVFDTLTASEGLYNPTIYWIDKHNARGAMYFEKFSNEEPAQKMNDRLRQILKLLEVTFIVVAFKVEKEGVPYLYVSCENTVFNQITVYDISIWTHPVPVKTHKNVDDLIAGRFLHLLRNAQSMN